MDVRYIYQLGLRLWNSATDAVEENRLLVYWAISEIAVLSKTACGLFLRSMTLLDSTVV